MQSTFLSSYECMTSMDNNEARLYPYKCTQNHEFFIQNYYNIEPSENILCEEVGDEGSTFILGHAVKVLVSIQKFHIILLKSIIFTEKSLE